MGVFEFSRIRLANVPEYNEAAIALLKKFGFTQEVCRRKSLERDRRRWDMYIYGLLRDEWLSQAGS